MNANLSCPHCGRTIFRFSYAWHLYHVHDINARTPAGGWTQVRADEHYARRWQ